MTKAGAQEIVRTLVNAGHIAYFAGGWVRDFLLGHPTDEIDIATSASPEKVQELFPKTILVGVEFGVVVVVFQGVNYEVTTFRKDHPYQDGRHPTGVDFSSPEKDALRRDFTINGMFYDPLTEEIHDYVHGREDLQEGIIRAIGNPTKRFQEDRLRMIRAVRFATRLDFLIEKETREAILEQANTLFPAVSIERVWQELKKMRPFSRSIEMMHDFGLLEQIFKPKYLIPNHLSKISEKVPTILLTIELFPQLTLEEKVNLARYLKVPNSDVKLVEFSSQSASLFKKTPSNWEWAHFYAHPHAEDILEIEKVKAKDEEQFHEEHERRKKDLAPHIMRIQQRKPLVTAAMLEKKGIVPGKKMGLLLQLAEKMAINEDLHDADLILSKLNFS